MGFLRGFVERLRRSARGVGLPSLGVLLVMRERGAPMTEDEIWAALEAHKDQAVQSGHIYALIAGLRRKRMIRVQGNQAYVITDTGKDALREGLAEYAALRSLQDVLQQHPHEAMCISA